MQSIPAMPSASTPATTLPLLAEPTQYVAARWELTHDEPKRVYWLALFRKHFETLLDEALREAAHRGEDAADARRRAEQARHIFQAHLDEVEAEPGRYGPLTILAICERREQILRDAGFDDPYRLAKARENEAALPLLRPLLDELDALPDNERDVAVMRGVFAGNIFDLGATQTVERFTHERVNFHDVRQQLKPRPWLVDDLDAWLDRLRRGPAHRMALLFVDNAGPDVMLGMLPFARHLLKRGTRVILTANTTPSLNDVTADELEVLVAAAAKLDDVLAEARASGALRVTANGNGYPLIDLTRLDPAFVAAIADEPIDLVVLEGMGRSLESNYHAKFACDALKLAMVKDRGVAEAMGGEVYDLVMRFDPA